MTVYDLIGLLENSIDPSELYELNEGELENLFDALELFTEMVRKQLISRKSPA